ncbi:hypothetical protein H6G00_11170 [Leptolyngbya sp. FACHB-541]|nr:hypothetical protein [Leptolyngbya sp. FACHB-541]MBD1997179.1 hypothetical protein [Leptolyngbya sp. FACHB-541]
MLEGSTLHQSNKVNVNGVETSSVFCLGDCGDRACFLLNSIYPTEATNH